MKLNLIGGQVAAYDNDALFPSHSLSILLSVPDHSPLGLGISFIDFNL